MLQYKQICSYPEAVDSVLASVYKHSWYLDSTLIPLALSDDNVGADEKSIIAQAILACPFYQLLSSIVSFKGHGEILRENEWPDGIQAKPYKNDLFFLMISQPE